MLVILLICSNNTLKHAVSGLHGLTGLTDAEEDALIEKRHIWRSLEDQIKDCKARHEKELSVIQDAFTDARKRFGDVFNTQSAVLRKLPVEVLSSIFQFTRQGLSLHGAEGDTHEVTLSHVCQRWRYVALSMPSLWNVFRYRYTARPCRKHALASLKRLPVYISRAKRYPLDIWVDFSGEKKNEDDGALWHDMMVDIIVREMHHCRTLQIKFHTDDQLIKLAPRLPRTAPMLEVLDLSFEKQLSPRRLLLAHPDREWNPSVFAEGAPFLTHVRCVDMMLFNVRAPLTNLVHLQFDKQQQQPKYTFKASVFDEILQSPCLETLSIYAPYFNVDRRDTEDRCARPPIEARSLKHFRCGDMTLVSGTLPVYFLQNTSAPLLETLAFHSVGLGLLLPEDIELNARRLTFPLLHTLHIVDWVAASNYNGFLWGLGAMTPNLKNLFISHPPTQYGQTLDLLVDHLHPLPEDPDYGHDEPIWRNIEDVTLNHLLMSYHVYEGLVTGLPKLKTVRVPWMTRRRLQQHVNFFVPDGVVLEDLDDEKHPVSLHWPPGTEWIDDEESPFRIKYKVGLFFLYWVTMLMF